MSALRALINNLVKENFIGKEKKQLIFWQLFSFPIKVMSKLFYNGLLINTLRVLFSIFHKLKWMYGSGGIQDLSGL